MTRDRGRFACVDVVGALVKNCIERDRTAVRGDLAAAIVRGAAPDARWELFRAGTVAVGGGPTTDSQWSLAR